MKVLILGMNYAPEEVGVGVYTSGMAEALAAMGHAVEVVAGKPYYPKWQLAPVTPRFPTAEQWRRVCG